MRKRQEVTGRMTLPQAKAALAAWSNGSPPPVRQQLMILASLRRLKQQALAKPRRTLADALRGAMRAFRPPKKKPRTAADLGLLSGARLARVLGLSGDQVTRLKSRGVLRGMIVGRRMLFDPEVASAAVAAHAIEVADARANSRRRAAQLTCCRCGQLLPRDQFIPTTERQRQRGKLYVYKTVSSDCRECRKVQKREARRKKAEAAGRVFEARGDRAAWLAQRRALREQRKRERKAAYEHARIIATALCRAFRALRDPEEVRRKRIARVVERQRERRHTDPKYKAKRLEIKLRRERLMKGTQTEPIEHEVVAKRDGWRCALCGGKVTRDDWSIDHVIPVSKGGPHTYANVVLMHKRCNSKRGPGRIPVQAPLFAKV